jgi:hypothetical protein
MNESENEIHQRSTNLDQEIYTRRRVLVGLCFVALLMACVFTVQALSSDSVPRSTPQVPALSTTMSPEITTTTTLAINGPPRVSIYGDSLAAGFGGLLKSILDRQGVTTFLATHGSSGLSQPGFFDWPNHLNVWVPQSALVQMMVKMCMSMKSRIRQTIPSGQLNTDVASPNSSPW